MIIYDNQPKRQYYQLYTYVKTYYITIAKTV